MRLTLAPIALLLLCSSACEEKPAGRKIASGIAQRLTVGPGAVAFVLDARRPDDRSVPEDLLAGDLYVARLDSGDAHRLGSGVSTADGGFAFSPRGDRLAFLAAWRFREGLGELWVAQVSGDPEQIAAQASTFAWSPDGSALAFVSPGKLGIRRGASGLRLSIDALQAIAWSPDGKRVAARTSASAGGKLFIVDAASGDLREIAPGTSDFAFAGDGTLGVLGPPPAKGGDRPLLLAPAHGAPQRVGRATAFAFSPDGRELALLSTDKQPGEPTGELFRLSRAGGTPILLGQRVSDWRFTPDGALVFLARYDLRGRAGALTLARPGAAPEEIAPRAQSFVVEGRRLLWLVPVVEKGDFRIELWTRDLGGTGPSRRVDAGVYGWQVSADGGTLFYKARCAGGPRSCSLFREPLDGSAAATLLATNVAGFNVSPDGARVLLEQPHRGAARAVDLAAIGTAGASPGEVKPFAVEADTSSRFGDPSGKRVVYATVTAGKGGVYVADLP
jgi:dipeptidyl aminopeptidase/acylaminoacyl peptidase